MQTLAVDVLKAAWYYSLFVSWYASSKYNNKEMLRSQGLPDLDRLRLAKLTKRQLQQAVGNAWSVNVVARIVVQLNKVSLITKKIGFVLTSCLGSRLQSLTAQQQ